MGEGRARRRLGAGLGVGEKGGVEGNAVGGQMDDADNRDVAE